MDKQQQAILRLQPDMIPRARQILQTAMAQLNEAIIDLGRRGLLVEPWLGDETSSGVAAYYTTRSMTDSNSSYRSLIAYHTELNRVHDTLKQMEDNYLRTEGDNSALWGRKA